MTIPRNDQLKASIVAKLKSEATILAQLSDTNEIREGQWQGDEFSYPAIRVRIIENKPTPANCNFSNIKDGIAVYSEQDSSQEADKIAGIIANELHTQSFTSVSIKFNNLKVDDLIPAIRVDERTWKAEIQLSGTANG